MAGSFARETSRAGAGVERPAARAVRPTLNRGTIDSLDDGARSRVTLELDFEGHGIGKLLVPLVVRRQAQKELPINVQNLKQRLESAAV